MAAVLSMIWLQLAAGSAAAMLVQGPASPEQAGAALAFGLFFSMVAIWMLTVRVEQCGGWSWLGVPAWCVSLVMPGIASAGPWVAGAIGVIGLMGGAVRFAWAWRKIPAGFQAAPYRAVVEKAASTKTGHAFAWSPLLGCASLTSSERARITVSSDTRPDSSTVSASTSPETSPLDVSWATHTLPLTAPDWVTLSDGAVT